MDDKKRKSLIKKFLGESANFDAGYSAENKEWFLEKLIRGLEAEGLSDSTVESETSATLTKAKAVVNTNRDFVLTLSAAGNTRYSKRLLGTMQRHRVEILYGAIAFNRQFVEPTNLKYLLFIARRRFRSICRMYVWVNPNRQGYFHYPDDCNNDPDTHWSVNENAKNYWIELTPPWFSNRSPWKLNASGLVDPVKALEILFTKKTDPCKSNMFDCEMTTSIVFADSLREAKNEDLFIKKLASSGAEYISVHKFIQDVNPNPTGRLISSFMADTSANGLFRKVGLPASDLQVGDQCYIINHPLYKVFRPRGSWTGEYSLVYATGDRNYRSERGFVFGGHGKEGTLYQFYDAFISELQSHLAIARQLMVAHLTFMRGGAAAIVPGTVLEEEHSISVGGAPAVAYRLMQYDKNVVAKDFTKVPTKTKTKPKTGAAAFVIVQSKTEHIFYLEQIDRPKLKKPLSDNLKKKITDIVPPGNLKNSIKFIRLTPPPGGATPDVIYALEDWGITYFDPITSKNEKWQFFVKVGAKLQRKELAHDDLFKSPFTLFLPKSTDLSVHQPKVDFSAAHQSFLTTNGGI